MRLLRYFFHRPLLQNRMRLFPSFRGIDRQSRHRLYFSLCGRVPILYDSRPRPVAHSQNAAILVRIWRAH